MSGIVDTPSEFEVFNVWRANSASSCLLYEKAVQNFQNKRKKKSKKNPQDTQWLPWIKKKT
jgi:hypothetical protein